MAQRQMMNEDTMISISSPTLVISIASWCNTAVGSVVLSLYGRQSPYHP